MQTVPGNVKEAFDKARRFSGNERTTLGRNEETSEREKWERHVRS